MRFLCNGHLRLVCQSAMPSQALGGEKETASKSRRASPNAHRYRLKPQVALVTEVIRRVCRTREDDALDTDAKFAISVVAGLVGDGHARLYGDSIGGWRQKSARGNGEKMRRRTYAGTHALRAFVDVQEGADAVSCAVSIASLVLFST